MKRNSWEDEDWKKEYNKVSKELDIPEKKPKEPLLVRLKIKKNILRWGGTYYRITKLGKTLRAIIIASPIIGLSIFGGIRQWSWHDEIVYGYFDGISTIQTEYGSVNNYSNLLNELEKGDRIPMKLRERIVRKQKPWKKYDTPGFGSPETPMRIDWEIFMKEIVGEDYAKFFGDE